MGGMLATGALSLQGYLSRHVRSVTMLGSGCYGAGSWHSWLKPLLLSVCALGFPGGFASSTYSTLIGTWASPRVIEFLFYWHSNVEASAGGRGGERLEGRPGKGRWRGEARGGVDGDRRGARRTRASGDGVGWGGAARTCKRPHALGADAALWRRTRGARRG